MPTEGTLFPGAADPPLDATDSDVYSAETLNTVDARARAAADKLGVDGDTRVATVDHRIGHIPAGLNSSHMTSAGDYVDLWAYPMTEGSAVTFAATVTGVLDGANEAIGVRIIATYRCKAGVANLVGAITSVHEKRAGLGSADVTFDTDGANKVLLRAKSGVADLVHWTYRGEAIVAQPGGF